MEEGQDLPDNMSKYKFYIESLYILIYSYKTEPKIIRVRQIPSVQGEVNNHGLHRYRNKGG